MRRRTMFLWVAAALTLAATPATAERGSSGELKLLYWQAPSIINPYLSGGTKEQEVSSLVVEPLANYDHEGKMVATLAAEIPTLENGGVAKDLKSITWKLKPDVVWSDGTPFTAEDVAFTAEYCMAPDGGCSRQSNFSDVEKVEAVDPLTVKISFSVPKPYPYGPFVGAAVPVFQKAQFKDCVGAKAPQCTDANFGPIGTGPFKVTDFKANDSVRFVANDKYRDPAKPAFASVYMKGGGDAASAARAVLETGEFDYAWNMQVEPEILAQMEAAGKGKIAAGFGSRVERIMVNLSNSRPEAGEMRSVYNDGKNPHPVLKDPAMRRALSLAIDRQILVDTGYGEGGKVTCNVLPAPEAFASTANDWCKTPDIEKANKLLDDAGWVKGSDGVRVKDGVRASLLFQTSTNSVRQATQALLKQMWGDIGVETELRNISASVFFGGDQSSPDTMQKFMADLEMFSNDFDGTDPETYMGRWLCKETPGPDNNWLGVNMPRYCNPEYDKLAEELAKSAETDKRAEFAKKMNDLLMDEGAIIPLIHRGRTSAQSNALIKSPLNPWDSELWDAADWSRKK